VGTSYPSRAGDEERLDFEPTEEACAGQCLGERARVIVELTRLEPDDDRRGIAGELWLEA
jgi:hypothetical protein